MSIDSDTWQVHATGNQNGRDLALRLTVTAYDEAGFEAGQKTFRRHVTGLQFDDLNAQATYVVCELLKMLDDSFKRAALPDEPDIPMF